MNDANLNLTMSPDGEEALEQREGFAPSISNDVGHPVIGYGSDLSPEEVNYWQGRVITPEEALQLLRSRTAFAEQAIRKAVDVPLSQSQFDALVFFAYNVGVGAFEGSTLLKKLNTGDYAGAAAEFPKWSHAGGQVLPGLLARRESEQQQFNLIIG